MTASLGRLRALLDASRQPSADGLAALELLRDALPGVLDELEAARDITTVAGQLRETTANLRDHIEAEALRIAEPAIQSATDAAAKTITDLKRDHAFEIQRLDNLVAELRRQLAARDKQIERIRESERQRPAQDRRGWLLGCRPSRRGRQGGGVMTPDEITAASNDTRPIPVVQTGKHVALVWLPWEGDVFAAEQPGRPEAPVEASWGDWMRLAAAILADPLTEQVDRDMYRAALELPPPDAGKVTEGRMRKRLRSAP